MSRGALGRRSDSLFYWMDREGKFTPLRETPASYLQSRVLYRREAFWPWKTLTAKRSDIWLYEWERDALTRLTFAGESNLLPRLDSGWPENRFFLSGERVAGFDLWWIRADGAGNAQRLAESNIPSIFAGSWGPDGKVFGVPPSPTPTLAIDIHDSCHPRRRESPAGNPESRVSLEQLLLRN